MASRHPKRRGTVLRSTPLPLHTAYCTESPDDLQRMRDLIKLRPHLLYTIQPNPPPKKKSETSPDPEARDVSLSVTHAPLVWNACQAQHLACVNLILQAEGPKNIKLLENFYCEPDSGYAKQLNILSYTLVYGKESERSCEIMRSLLKHGISPNAEIPISEISNPQILQVLKQYKAKVLIFPSSVVLFALKMGYSKILEILFEHGAYPEPVILTESGSVRPLYPTLGKHLNPIPDMERPESAGENLLEALLGNRYSFNICLKNVKSLKTLLVHGATLPPYVTRRGVNLGCQITSSQVLFIFDVIFYVLLRNKWMEGSHNANMNWGVKSDGSLCRYYDIILALLKLYHQFGGSLWWKMKSSGVPCEGGTGECVEWLRDPERVTPCKTIIDVLEEHIPDPEAQSMLVGEVERMMSTPPSLQHSARLAIRRSMGYGCVRNLEALPLPDGLKKYLKFELET